MKRLFLDYIQAKHPTTIISCECKTCKQIFLKDIFLLDFAEKSNALNIGRMQIMDDWFKSAEAHWKANRSHKIWFKCPPLDLPSPYGSLPVTLFPNNLTAFFEGNAKAGKI